MATIEFQNKGIWHGDIMVFKSLLPHPYNFICSQLNINIGDIMAKIKRICKQCGKVIWRYPSQIVKEGNFCSLTCVGEWNKVKKVCEQCGKEYTGSGKRFCSRKCLGEWQSENKRGENSNRWQGGMIERVCETCGKYFLAKPNRVKKGEGKFCSRSCSRKAQHIPTHHTKPELIFEEICKKYTLPFHYVGDGSLWIGKGKRKLNPDFIEANGKKICVEIMGAYWHSLLLNQNIKEERTLEYRRKLYRKHKWHPVFIWDTDLVRADAEQFVLSTLKRELI